MCSEILLEGSPVCDGVAIGEPFFFTVENEITPEFSIAAGEIGDEIKRYRRAIRNSVKDIIRLKKELESEGVVEGAAILEAHLHILRDPLITTHIEDRIKKTKKNSEYVFRLAMDEYEEKFNKISDNFFKERLSDLQDVYHRVMGYLRKSVRVSLVDIPDNSIIFARNLTPSDTVEAKNNIVNALVTEKGGSTSHTAILARAKSIPYVSNIDFLDAETVRGKVVVVDGSGGKVIMNPSKKTLEKYKTIQKKNSTEKIKTFSKDSKTLDGCEINISANVSSLEGIDLLLRNKGCCVGLMRSEYMFLGRGEFPSEEEQFKVYCKALKKLRGAKLTIRTFDVGGDKFGEMIECNGSVLGCRGIRFMFAKKDVFRSQLRAILRAGVFGNVRIIFPMISTIAEWRQAKDFTKEIQQELKTEGIKYDKNVELGCMIETPSAAIMSDVLAEECDFLSIGTNDLVQYSLAMDRNSLEMNHIHRYSYPSVIKLIKKIVEAGEDYNTPVFVCGEIAADRLFVPLLLGLGVKYLSVSPRFINDVREEIRKTNLKESSKLANKVLKMSTEKEIYEFLKTHAGG